MTRSNQLYVNPETSSFVCRSCVRGFNTNQGAIQHCRHARTHQGEWCERCEWLFVTNQALSSHLCHSSRHNVCDNCHLDFNAAGDLKDHGVEVHHMCVECGNYFSNRNNLWQVGISSNPWSSTRQPRSDRTDLCPNSAPTSPSSCGYRLPGL